MNGSITRKIISREIKIKINNAFLSSSYLRLYAFCKLTKVNITNPKESAYFSNQTIKIEPYKKMNSEKFTIFLHLVTIISISIILVFCIWRALSRQENEYDEKVKQEVEMKVKIEEFKIVALFLKKLWKRDKEKAEKERARMLRERETRIKTVNLDEIVDSEESFEEDSSEEFDLATGEKVKRSTFRPQKKKADILKAIGDNEEIEDDIEQKIVARKRRMTSNRVRELNAVHIDTDDEGSRNFLDDDSSSSSRIESDDSDY